MRSLHLSVQTIYQDLVAAHRDRAVNAISGTPFLKETVHGGYWYARQRIGDRVVDRYIGPDTPDIRAIIETGTLPRAVSAEFDRQSSERINQLRAAGLPSPDRDTGKVLGAIAKAGTFRLGGTLVGTHAFRLYAAELGVVFSDVAASTQDIDIASFENLKLVIEDTTEPSLADTMAALHLQPVPTLDRKNRTTRWSIPGGNVAVDFLVPRMTDAQDVVFLKPLGVHAQGLPFLNFLIADPIPAVVLYRSGILVQIPQPERFAVHKLIVSQRRSGLDRSKARKDLLQAETLFSVMAEDRPYLLADALEKARQSGPAWRQAIDRALAMSPVLTGFAAALPG